MEECNRVRVDVNLPHFVGVEAIVRRSGIDATTREKPRSQPRQSRSRSHDRRHTALSRANTLQPPKRLERAKGLEPSTSTLARLRSTTELRPRGGRRIPTAGVVASGGRGISERRRIGRGGRFRADGWQRVWRTFPTRARSIGRFRMCSAANFSRREGRGDSPPMCERW